MTLFRLLALCFVLLLAACASDDNPPAPADDEPEVITTVRIQLTDSAGVQPDVEVFWRDSDGDQIADQIDTLTLATNTTYLVNVSFFNELLPVDSTDEEFNVTLEIQGEADEHMLLLGVTDAGGTALTAPQILYTDDDGRGCALGLEGKLRTGGSTLGLGFYQVVLRHQPGLKTYCTARDSVVDNNVSNQLGSGIGEADIDIELPLKLN